MKPGSTWRAAVAGLPGLRALGAIVVLAAFSLGTPAAAQPRRGGNAGAVERRGSGAPLGSLERREQIKKRIRAMRAFTLTEELALDEQTAGRLFPVLARYDDETDKLLARRVDVQRRLRRAEMLRDPRAIDQLIDEAVANQRGFWDLEDRRIADLRKILTPAQTAKLLVVLPAIERRIQNQLRKAIVRGSGASELDDDLEADEIGPRSPAPRRREVPLAPRPPPSNAPGATPPCDPSAGPCR